MAEPRRHPRDQSQLYKVTSPAMLASRLNVTADALDGLLVSKSNYSKWIDRKTGRPIQEPKQLLAKVHRRVSTLLSRIVTPDFLHSAVKGRSYITNATAHDASVPCVKVDIRKFYPSTRAQAVYHFFRDRMNCDGDVAGMLARLLTVDGHLATGSSVSPILSYFTYEDMFCELEQVAANHGCKMTCYVDDMVFSGHGATRKLIRDVILVVKKYRLWGHKAKIFKSGQPRIITGVAITSAGPKVPNKRQKAISVDLTAFGASKDDQQRLNIARRASGRLFEAATIDRTWRNRATNLAEQQRGIERRMKKMRSATGSRPR